MQLNIISQYLYIVNNALINWGGLSDGWELVAEEIYWFGQGWNSPSHKSHIPKNMLNHCYKAHRANLKSKYDLLVYFTVKLLRIFFNHDIFTSQWIIMSFCKVDRSTIFFLIFRSSQNYKNNGVNPIRVGPQGPSQLIYQNLLKNLMRSVCLFSCSSILLEWTRTPPWKFLHEWWDWQNSIFKALFSCRFLLHFQLNTRIAGLRYT